MESACCRARDAYGEFKTMCRDDAVKSNMSHRAGFAPWVLLRRDILLFALALPTVRNASQLLLCDLRAHCFHPGATSKVYLAHKPRREHFGQ